MKKDTFSRDILGMYWVPGRSTVLGSYTSNLKPTYLEPITLFKTVNNVGGDYFECGFGAGSSAKLTIHSMTQGILTKRNVCVADSFEGFPELSEYDRTTKESKKRNAKKGSLNTSFQPALDLKNFYKKYININIFKGFFKDTLHKYEGTIAILFLDCDLYTSYKTSLETLYDKVCPGGLILFDEYKSKVYPGATVAIDNFFKNKNIEIKKLRKMYYVIKP
tara:strand:- start:54 stop:713 length:660 start_codon:yes stop_codon:yes gene_type:complete